MKRKKKKNCLDSRNCLFETIGNVLEDANEWRRADSEANEQEDFILGMVLRCCTIGPINAYFGQIRGARD